MGGSRRALYRSISRIRWGTLGALSAICLNRRKRFGPPCFVASAKSLSSPQKSVMSVEKALSLILTLNLTLVGRKRSTKLPQCTPTHPLWDRFAYLFVPSHGTGLDALCMDEHTHDYTSLCHGVGPSPSLSTVNPLFFARFSSRVLYDVSWLLLWSSPWLLHSGNHG